MNIGLVCGGLITLLLAPAVLQQLAVEGHYVGAVFAGLACLLPIPIGWVMGLKDKP